MNLPLEEFVKQLEDSGVLAGDTIIDFLPPRSEPKDAEELARELVRQKKLTTFQAEEISKGKGKSLVLGNYVLMEKIGAGGMGQVFKAEHRRMHRTVAIKMLPSHVTQDAAAIARFEREVTAAAKLRHPNIVAADDADCANDVHFLVMEMVEGSDLSALVTKNGPLPVDKAVNYILQAAKGLEFAHKKGIVHRDIKPANLLLNTEGTVKILDMGLARLSLDGGDAPQADLTGTCTVMGTVDYMAPEQALSTKTADARADIYALGCSLYYLLTGKATYGGESLMAKLLAHREHPIPSLRGTCPGMPEQVEAVFKKMVAKTVQDRYQTMTEVIAALEQCGPRREPSVGTQQLPGTFSDTGLTSLLKDASAATAMMVPKKKVKKPLIGKNQKKWLLISSGILGVLLLLAALVVNVKTKDGTLIVTVNEPDAEVQVLNEEGQVEITRKGDQEPITISVDPGKHRLKVTKDGFQFFTQDFTMESGGKQPITAKLVPLEEKPPALVANSPLATPVPAVMENLPGVVGGRKPLAFETPGFDQWVKVVVALPAEEQVKAVAEKMRELNPGFDGLMEPTIGEGIVLSIAFISDNVTDISPLRAFTNLSYLECNGSEPEKGMLADLSPLRGKSLRGVWCSNTKIADLSPLKDMPIKRLTCQFTSVSDLSPLSGMPLANLRCTATKIADLSPLKGMQLSELQVEETLVSDLWALKGMHLTALAFSGTPASDITPLRGMPLVTLICSQHVTDLSPIKGMPLKMLSVDFKPERDTELLRSIKTLETINLKPAADFWMEVDEQQKGKKPATE